MEISEDSRQLAAICAIAKNEGPYLAEWAVYHRMIGFDQVLVYNNESSDDSADVLARLKQAGILESVDWPSSNDGRVQKTAYADGLKRLRPAFQWVAFVDLDEFVFVPGFNNSIRDFLEHYAHLDAIAINWKLFGTSGHHKKKPGLVIERFTRCADTHHSGNRAIKTFVKTRALKTPNLHNHEFAEGVLYQTVAGEVIPPGVGRSTVVNHDVICLHHYFTKSREEWEAKVARGRATKPDGHPEKLRREEHYRRHNRNNVTDLSLARYAGRVKEKLASLGF